MPGAHKIGAAISGPRIAGGNLMDITLFLIVGDVLGWRLCGTELPPNNMSIRYEKLFEKMQTKQETKKRPEMSPKCF